MYEYSIDRAQEKIYNLKTKEYFSEVLSSYSIGNYRSAIVMLYSVLIADLYYKLRELSERDEDPKANNILDYIRTQISDRERNSKSEWESKVIEKVFTETQLLEQSAKTHIDYIKQLRNLSAHPVLDSEDLLSTPNKDTVRAAIHNALEFVLTKPAMYSDKIAEEFMENIPSYSSLIFRTEKYETYLKNRYFNFFTDRVVKKVFNYLWIAVYKGQDEQAEAYREEYFDTLNIVFINYREILDIHFKEERVRFNRINLEEREQLEFFIDFFYKYPYLYKYISEDNRVVVSHKVEESLSLFTRAWFVTGDKKEHIEKVFKKYIIKNKKPTLYQIDILYQMSVEEDLEGEFYNFCINLLDKGSTYVNCLNRWREFIEPFIEEFSEKHIVKLLSVMNSNSSLYNAHWLEDEYISQIKNHINQTSIDSEKWNDIYKNLPEYKVFFNYQSNE